MNVRDIDVGKHRKPDHPVPDLIWKRWSPRAMAAQPLSQAELVALLEAARWAPSSYNEQPWRFVYAHRGTPHFDRLFGLLVEGNKAWCKNAGVLIVVVSKKSLTATGKPNRVHTFDCGAAWQNLALHATASGFVAHGMVGFDYDRARTELGIPEDFQVEAMIALGRPGNVEDLPEAGREREKPSGRKPVTEFMLEGGFAAK
jgi:nitroreductase